MVEITKLRIAPAYQVVSEELQRLIMDGVMKPGDQLPGEIDLAARFGVNRSTVREGIRQLEAEGLLRREGRKRLLIAVPNQIDLSPRMERALLMNDVRFIDLWQVARALEPLAVTLAVARITAAEIEVLEANVAATATAVQAGEPTDRLDTKFHTLLAEFSGNRALLLSREPIGQLLFRPYVEIGKQVIQAPQRNLAAHQEILSALRTRDAEGASNWMVRHIEDLKRGWQLAGREMDDPISQK